MTAGSMYGPRGRSWLVRFLVAWGHAALPLMWAMLLVVPVRPLLGFWLWPKLGPVPSAVFTVFAAVLTVSIVGIMVHDRRLCLRDSVPWVNPAGEAERRLGWLRLSHRRVLMWVLTGMVFLMLLAGAPARRIHDGPLWLRLVASAVVLAGIGAALVAERSFRLHNALQPWCPWCHDDDGEDERASEPTPDPAGTATR